MMINQVKNPQWELPLLLPSPSDSQAYFVCHSNISVSVSFGPFGFAPYDTKVSAVLLCSSRLLLLYPSPSCGLASPSVPSRSGAQMKSMIARWARSEYEPPFRMARKPWESEVVALLRAVKDGRRSFFREMGITPKMVSVFSVGLMRRCMAQTIDGIRSGWVIEWNSKKQYLEYHLGISHLCCCLPELTVCRCLWCRWCPDLTVDEISCAVLHVDR